jgi:hypothetical protein
MYFQTAVAHKEYFNYVYNLFRHAKDYIPQSKIFKDRRTKKNT